MKTGLFGTYSKDVNVVAVNQYTMWRFYQGFNRISEPEFLKITGFYQESIQAKKFHTTNTVLDVIGYTFIGGSFVGLGIALYGIFANYGEDFGSEAYTRNFELQAIGLSINLGAALVALIPAIARLIRGDHWMPLEQALGIKNDYNRTLKDMYR